ncbi:alpha/beta hydrolase [Salinarimonas ramus]|uniref:Alpha/beta hydrolase n=1 Tax=Salinarimonas ramus TaxID=690164 RepID=A0A917Q5F0_9HYPH|nr:alpha/beta fold hydrolase [Salinarimonas ramus]GGK24509.1 alpha/beta hydrolase [Salinarimonas ramus]
MPSQTSPTDTGAPRGGYTVQTRRVARANAPALELVETLPDGARTGAPLLLIHGAFGGAWMWAEHLGPYLARRGRASLAVSLRAHGGSEGRESLRDITLDDYVDDVRFALERLPQAPVVVGHSLGGLLAQKLIGRAQMRGLVLVSSLPPEGLATVNLRTAMTEPVVWLDAFLGAAVPEAASAAAAMTNGARTQLFSDGLAPARARRYAAMMVPEAPRALAQANVPGPILSAFLTRLPTLVVGSAQDRLVWRSCTLRTAFYHAARHETLDPSGHFPMLDVSAETLGRKILAWLDAEGL